MKKIIYFLLIGLIASDTFSQTGSVGIGTNTPNNSAALEIQSTTKGILIPRMTTAQRNIIASPATGLLVYDNTTNSFWFKSVGDWVELTDTMNNVWRKNGTNAYANVPGNVGIGTNAPQYHLDINKPNASIGFTDSELNQFSGSITGNAGDLNIIASRVLFGQGTPGNLILQNSSGFAVGGNVGIGNSNPSHKLDVTGDVRINGNVGIGVSNPFHKLQVDGSLLVNNFVLRPPTGNANLVPVCYGIVNANGSASGGSGNFLANDVEVLGALQGYHITVNNLSVNLNTDVVLVTPFNPENGENLTTTVLSPSAIGYPNSGGFYVVFRLASPSFPLISRSGFSFVIYRP